ncbi:hypothetical protein DRO97_08780 [Archaeoglobales archaeon]|nr:MAG: hypothetical protein DRO97_08780 [Archaeoglobales archaeon]
MDVLFNPDKYFREVKDKISYKIPLLIVTISGVLGLINGYLIAKPMASAVVKMLIKKGITKEQAQMIAAFTQISTIGAPLVTTFVLWVVIAATLHIVSSLFGGKGNFSTTLKLSAFSFIPNIILFPLNLYISIKTIEILNIYGLEGLNSFEFKSTAILLGIVTLVWQYTYWVFVVKNARELEIKKANIAALVLLILFIIPIIYSSISIIH